MNVPLVNLLGYHATWSHASHPFLCHGMHMSSTILYCVRPEACVSMSLSALLLLLGFLPIRMWYTTSRYIRQHSTVLSQHTSSFANLSRHSLSLFGHNSSQLQRNKDMILQQEGSDKPHQHCFRLWISRHESNCVCVCPGRLGGTRMMSGLLIAATWMVLRPSSGHSMALVSRIVPPQTCAWPLEFAQ